MATGGSRKSAATGSRVSTVAKVELEELDVEALNAAPTSVKIGPSPAIVGTTPTNASVTIDNAVPARAESGR